MRERLMSVMEPVRAREATGVATGSERSPAGTVPAAALRAAPLHPLYAILTLAYVAGLSWLSSLPRAISTQSSSLVEASLNLIHIPLFGGLTFCFVKTLSRGNRWRPLSRRSWFVITACLAGFAIVNELQQRFVPGRSASMSDVLLDFVGIGLTLLILQIESLLGDRK